MRSSAARPPRSVSRDAPQVLASTFSNQIQRFDADGNPLKAFNPRCLASMVRVVKPAKNRDEEGLLAVAGTRLNAPAAAGQYTLVGVTPSGFQEWGIDATFSAIPKQKPLPEKQFLAAAALGAWLHVIDTSQGAIVASTKMFGRFEWFLGKDEAPPLLLVATTQGLKALRVAQ